MARLGEAGRAVSDTFLLIFIILLLCPFLQRLLGAVQFGAMVIRHGPYTPTPLFGNQKSVKAPSPNAEHFFIPGR